MSDSVVKALVLCNEISDSANGAGQKDLRGAGLTAVRSPGPFPIKHTFWVYMELTDRKPSGSIQLAIMRADSGRRYFFRIVPVQFPDPLQSIIVAMRVFDCTFPAVGVYYVELWYDGEWVMDQRLEVV